MLRTVGARGSRRGFPWLSKSKHSVAAGVAGAHSPLTPNKWNPIPLRAPDPVPGLWWGGGRARACGSPAPPEQSSARVSPPPAAAAAAWLHCISSHTKEPPRRSTTNGEYRGINPDGKLFFPLWEYSPQRLGRVADLCRT